MGYWKVRRGNLHGRLHMMTVQAESNKEHQELEQQKARLEATRQAFKPEPRRLLESEFANPDRRKHEEEYSYWQREQARGKEKEQ